MINLIFFIFGAVCGWFLKFAFDFYHNFKDLEQKRASEIDDILVKFKVMEEMKEIKAGDFKTEKKPKPM